VLSVYAVNSGRVLGHCSLTSHDDFFLLCIPFPSLLLKENHIRSLPVLLSSMAELVGFPSVVKLFLTCLPGIVQPRQSKSHVSFPFLYICFLFRFLPKGVQSHCDAQCRRCRFSSQAFSDIASNPRILLTFYIVASSPPLPCRICFDIGSLFAYMWP